MTNEGTAEPTEYKGLSIGDMIYIPAERCEELFSPLAEVTGFNPSHDIVHYQAPTIYGGLVHTGEKFDNVSKANAETDWWKGFQATALHYRKQNAELRAEVERLKSALIELVEVFEFVQGQLSIHSCGIPITTSTGKVKEVLKKAKAQLKP